MSGSPRRYLAGRFRADAAALHRRAETLASARDGRPSGGPDAAASTRMAVACETVAAMVEAVAVGADEPAALAALIPLLEQRAAAAASDGHERAVFAGAATRLREVLAADTRPTQGEGGDARGSGAPRGRG